MKLIPQFSGCVPLLFLCACGGDTTAPSTSIRIPVTRIEYPVKVGISPPAATLSPGEKLQFVASGTSANGVAISHVVFTWSSSDTAVAVISSTGLLTARQSGTTTIRAQGPGSATAPVTVR